MKLVEDGQYRNGNQNFRSEGENSGSQNYRGDGERIGRCHEIQCYECNEFSHIKPECPVAKRNEMKCSECKGNSHSKDECPILKKGKDKSFISFSESELEEDEEEMLNFVAFMGMGDQENQELSDSEDEGEFDPKAEYPVLYDSWVKLSSEKVDLTRESLKLEAQLDQLQEELTENKDKGESVITYPEVLQKKTGTS